ncbi:L,D-transpeptidase family protein [Vibrio hannami]|uniref:L,D-transpeptidase family protein n=1 Tax=Vibrio hannami TaxID=2717094 RepID=UPI0024105F28|nr:L,D-transpeptidase family protein [Vibrio hannami]MDG3085843.1 L,D-transpeptidase family protein [Vibrio hannami]
MFKFFFIPLFTLFISFLVQASEPKSTRTLEEAIEAFTPRVRAELTPYFDKANIIYPPDKVTLLAIKERHIVEVWATSGAKTSFIKQYFIWSASGDSGPKLEEGDKQVPEGIYKVIGLNPNSKYHLSMALNYPNEFDMKWAKADKRHDPGGDIFIHGDSYSVGCLAMGNKNIEELFILAVDTGIRNFEVIIAPGDPRKRRLERKESDPKWVDTLYKDIESAFKPFNLR